VGGGSRRPADLVDDAGSAATAGEAYAQWVDTIDLLLGPYSSGLVRAIAPLVATPAGCSGITVDQPMTWPNPGWPLCRRRHRHILAVSWRRRLAARSTR
jgi:hypothetical protein